ncbi:Protein of unknown function [Actinokineospora alba]|uniref:DUF1203 domain-containing protein n=1 Tax=Actinokineospora alba TaxID=504798 RepID=A0A1H0I1G5_9PSEU|nr:DUF1203 domain-containing protein [Actinokineospora alba]TDP64660.1 uncharacterized protein DUF1203 [Actinokineospora alba]SDI84736.1 Protein of unknown function [Actinokineospora alba]SDO24960.1 Protein of unknown function [Actinokineospora alba]
MTFEFHAIPAAVLAEVRSKPAQPWTAGGGEPLRCCLRNAVAGEELILFNYEPPLPWDSPYREKGAVFAHPADCDGPAATDRYPSDWLGKPQVLRAYDRRGWIHPSTTVHDGQDPQGVIAKQLADPDVAWVHSRNIAYGCYMFTVTRAAGR